MGSEALELMEKLTLLERSVAHPVPPTVDLAQGPGNAQIYGPDVDEEMGEDEEDEIDGIVSTAVAEAWEEARKSGKDLSADELKDVQKTKRVAAKKVAKAQGKFQVIQRSKKTNGVPTLVDAVDAVAS